MRLNLGCGDEHLDGWVNVDLRTDCGADLIADVAALPYPDESVDELRAHDLIEHFPRSATDKVLFEWRRVLTPGGRLELKLPNMEALAEAILARASNGVLVDALVRNIYGGHRWGPDGAWDTHHWGWTPSTLARDLDGAGFEVVSNDEGLNMTVVATRRP